MANNSKDEILILRIDKEVKRQLQKLAKADDRTLSSFIRVQLMKVIENSKK